MQTVYEFSLYKLALWNVHHEFVIIIYQRIPTNFSGMLQEVFDDNVMHLSAIFIKILFWTGLLQVFVSTFRLF